MPKMKLLIDDSYFTCEVYSRAKSMLSAKFGKPSEVAAEVQSITFLPVILNSKLNHIHEFYEKLVISV